MGPHCPSLGARVAAGAVESAPQAPWRARTRRRGGRARRRRRGGRAPQTPWMGARRGANNRMKRQVLGARPAVALSCAPRANGARIGGWDVTVFVALVNGFAVTTDICGQRQTRRDRPRPTTNSSRSAPSHDKLVSRSAPSHAMRSRAGRQRGPRDGTGRFRRKRLPCRCRSRRCAVPQSRSAAREGATARPRDPRAACGPLRGRRAGPDARPGRGSA